MENINITIGIMIAKIRSDMGISQEAFGKLLSRTGTIVSRWESGKRTPGMAKYREILDLYNEYKEQKK